MSKNEKNLDLAYEAPTTQVLASELRDGQDGPTTQESDEVLAHTHEGDFGTKRDLSPRIVSMIAIAGTIGTGLFLGSGSALIAGGPVGFWLGYVFMGLFVAMMMTGLGEMSCFDPNIGGFVDFGNKYVDPAMGLMMGINYILQVGLAIPAEMSAIAVMISYWDPNTSHAGIYIAVFLVFCMCVNIVGVRYFGEIEFFFACIKLCTLVGLVLFGLIVDLGGIPGHKEFIGGRYWREEPFNDTFKGLTPVSKARFLGFWAVLTKVNIRAAFSYGGIEGIAVLAGEARNPRKTMRMAVRTVFYRVVGIYFLSTLIISLAVSQHSPLLKQAVGLGGHTAASSPFVVMCKQTGVKVLPSIINAVVMTSALSAGNEDTYAASRTMMGLARQGSLPKIFLKTTSRGVPLANVGVCFCFGLLAFLSLSNGSSQAFSWLSNISALSSLVGWLSISICFIRFRKALVVQGIRQEGLSFRGYLQPYLAYACVFFFTLVIIFNGFQSFIGGFDYQGFLASYITIPAILIAFFGYKIARKSHMVALGDIDLSRGPYEALRGTRYDLGL